jgi:hypothetical protein
MANVAYAKFLQALGDGAIDLGAGTFKCALVDTGVYTVDASDTGHEFESDLSGVLDEADLVSPTWVARVFDAADFVGTFPDSGGGGTGEAIVIYKDTGTPATSQLMFYFDTVTGLPVTQDGTADSITFNASGIWKLGA